MGYTFTIGNATPFFDKADGELYACWKVEGCKLDTAPSFPNDEMTGKTNMRSPSYSAWADFCRQVGLYDLFYDHQGNLHAGHPGCVQITKKDLTAVRRALHKWRGSATKEPGFCSWPVYNKETGKHETFDEDRYDPYLARLIWLEFWMSWALKNCETPAIQNT